MSDPTAEAVAKNIATSLDEEVDAARLALKANYSTAQYYRIVRRGSQSTPMAVRRRLLLERAAYELIRTAKSVSEIGCDADFESLAGFCRTFKRAFGVAPLQFRKLGPSDYRIDAAERIHYAPAGAPVGPRRQGDLNMKLLERLIEHHRWSVHRILDACRGLDPGQLDREIASSSPFPWDECKETLRRLLQQNVSFAQPWLESINGEKLSYDKSSIDGLHAGLDQNCDAISRMATTIEQEGRWDMTFVDALCEPPEVFSFIGVFGHMITYNAYRRVLLINELKQIGITDLGFGDPIEFDPTRRTE